MRDEEVFNQDVSQEQAIVDLLQDAKRSTTTSSSRVNNSSNSVWLMLSKQYHLLNMIFNFSFIIFQATNFTLHWFDTVGIDVCPFGAFFLIFIIMRASFLNENWDLNVPPEK